MTAFQGRCPRCRSRVMLDANGTVMRHNTPWTQPPHTCAGTGEKPKGQQR